MSAVEVVATHDGTEPHVFLWIDPESVAVNGPSLQSGPLSLDEARALALELLDAIEAAERLGR